VQQLRPFFMHLPGMFCLLPDKINQPQAKANPCWSPLRPSRNPYTRISPNWGKIYGVNQISWEGKFYYQFDVTSKDCWPQANGLKKRLFIICNNSSYFTIMKRFKPLFII
jgi:hypothetical protein